MTHNEVVEAYLNCLAALRAGGMQPVKEGRNDLTVINDGKFGMYRPLYASEWHSDGETEVQIMMASRMVQKVPT